MRDRLSRRDALRGLATLSVPLAGCPSQGEDRVTPTDRTTTAENGTRTPTDGDPGTTPGATTPSLEGLVAGAEPLATGFTSPVGVEVPRPGRYAVVDQPGRVVLIENGSRHTYLDIRDRVVDVTGGYSEMGLLGLAFHPEFASNGRLFVRYSAPPRPGTPDDYDHTFLLSEFSTEPGATSVDPATERTVMELPQPQPNHNSGALLFGPDGYLYVGTGDGGGANDTGTGHVQDWYGRVRGGNGQDVTENLLGSVLRIDVDDRADGTAYGIPDGNPLVGRAGLDEQFAWGFRNPWRMSFGPRGRLLVADVGQNRYEEVDVVRKGGNYGWNVYEGTHCFRQDSCPRTTPDGATLEPPVIEYGHGDAAVSGLAVVGGYLYDGTALPEFRGLYVFADWQANGRLFAARPTTTGLWETTTVPVANDDFGPKVLAFGRDADGELLVCTTENVGVTGSTGRLFRLRPV